MGPEAAAAAHMASGQRGDKVATKAGSQSRRLPDRRGSRPDWVGRPEVVPIPAIITLRSLKGTDTTNYTLCEGEGKSGY